MTKKAHVPLNSIKAAIQITKGKPLYYQGVPDNVF